MPHPSPSRTVTAGTRVIERIAGHLQLVCSRHTDSDTGDIVGVLSSLANGNAVGIVDVWSLLPRLCPGWRLAPPSCIAGTRAIGGTAHRRHHERSVANDNAMGIIDVW